MSEAQARYRLLRDPKFAAAALLVIALVAMAALPASLAPGDPLTCSISDSLRPPSSRHPFGFDLLGCDYYTRTIYGARASLLIAVLVVAIAAVIAVLLGTPAGYYGGWLDTVIGRGTDVIFSIPLIVGGLIALTFLERRGLAQVTAVLALLGWPPMLRLVRASVIAQKQLEYVQAARALGAGDLRIMIRHILPNALTPLIVYASAYAGIAISAEAILSFMGVGLQLPTISWGLMLSEASSRILGAPHLLIPGAFLSIAVFAFVLLGEALGNALDPEATLGQGRP